MSVLQREMGRILNCLDQVYLSHFNLKFTPCPRNHWCYPTCYYELHTSSMLKWKPKAPDNVLTSAKVAPVLSEIICTTGFLSSLCQFFAHQCCLCLHCDNLTDTQISIKKVLSIYSLPVVLVWHYLGCLPGVKGGKEGWMPWLITMCYQAFLLYHHLKCKVSSDWPSSWPASAALWSSWNAINSHQNTLLLQQKPCCSMTCSPSPEARQWGGACYHIVSR